MQEAEVELGHKFEASLRYKLSSRPARVTT